MLTYRQVFSRTKLLLNLPPEATIHPYHDTVAFHDLAGNEILTISTNHYRQTWAQATDLIRNEELPVYPCPV